MPLSNPVVSVVIPYHDRPLHLDRVLTAYEIQSYQDLELIVVDDGLSSLMELERVIGSRKIEYCRNPYRHPYGRPAHCRNIGAVRAQGDIIVFNDVDVIPEAQAVARIVRAHLESQGLIICGRIWRIERGLEAVKSMETNKADELKAVSKPMEYDPSLKWSRVGLVQRSGFWWSFISGLCSFRREDFFPLLGWDPQYFGWGYEDTDLGYRILQHDRSIAFFDDIMGFHIDHPIGAAQDRLNNLTALRNLNYFTQKFPELKSFPVLARRRRELEKATGASRILLEDPLKARSHYLEFQRFLEHPLLYLRTLNQRRRSRRGSIAVVIPAKNRAPYLEEAVLSSVNQTRPPREVYIIVDPSEDGTDVLAKDLSRRFSEIQCIVNEKDRGVAESRNQGIVSATSDYIMFLDSDDVLDPRYFEKVAALLDQNPDIGIAYSDYREFGERNRVIKLPVFNPRILLVDCIVMGPAMARRRALEQAGGYDVEQVFEDWELWIRVVEKGWTAKGVKEPLYNYRLHQGNRDKESNIRRKEGEDLIYRKHVKLYDHYGISRTVDGRWVNPPIYPPFR